VLRREHVFEDNINGDVHNVVTSSANLQRQQQNYKHLKFKDNSFSYTSLRGPIFEKSYDEFTIINFVITKLWQTYDDEFMIINMLIFERSYDDFMIVSYDKVMVTNNFRLRLF